jgi:hypothetical protein
VNVLAGVQHLRLLGRLRRGEPYRPSAWPAGVVVTGALGVWQFLGPARRHAWRRWQFDWLTPKQPGRSTRPLPIEVFVDEARRGL